MVLLMFCLYIIFFAFCLYLYLYLFFLFSAVMFARALYKCLVALHCCIVAYIIFQKDVGNFAIDHKTC